jgi:hypothetical protein
MRVGEQIGSTDTKRQCVVRLRSNSLMLACRAWTLRLRVSKQKYKGNSCVSDVKSYPDTRKGSF